jgi:hypothetical protein
MCTIHRYVPFFVLNRLIVAHRRQLNILLRWCVVVCYSIELEFRIMVYCHMHYCNCNCNWSIQWVIWNIYYLHVCITNWFIIKYIADFNVNDEYQIIDPKATIDDSSPTSPLLDGQAFSILTFAWDDHGLASEYVFERWPEHDGGV